MQRGTIRRIYELDRMIRLGRFTSAEAAAKELEVSRRTIERDIEELRYSLGAELVYDRAGGCYRYKDDAFTLPAQWLTEREIALILIAERALRAFTGASFAGEVHPAFNRLLAPIRHDRTRLQYVYDLCSAVHFHQPFAPARDVSAEFAAVLDAVMDRRRLSMFYDTSGVRSEKRRELEPYALVNNGGEWYAVGLCRNSGKVKTFVVSQIREPRVEKHSYEIPEKFDATAYLESGFGRMQAADAPADVTLRAGPPASAWVGRSVWHRSQKIERLDKGSIRLTMRCPITDSLIRWVLQMGECVVVEAPDALRTAVADRAAGIVRNNGRP
jgi:predicted DNA-binding transcriptional regulator YafY